MDEPVSLSFRYKGARKYVQGPDIFDSLLCNFEVVPPLRLLVRHYLTTGATAVLCSAAEGEPPSAAATLLYAMGTDEERQIAVYADKSRPVVESYPYDEDAIIESVRFGSDTLRVEPNDKFSPIERIVAANKLLLKHSPKSGRSKWWFPRIDLDEHLERDATYQLVLSGMRGHRFAESRIERDAAVIGRIYFFARGDDEDGRGRSPA